MLKAEIGDSGILATWVLIAFVLWGVVAIMRNNSDGHHQQRKNSQGRASSNNNGFLPSFRAFSSYLRIVSSGASTVARSAASVAQSIVDRDDDTNHDQVQWAGFDKLESEGDVTRQVLLLGYRTGFQVWDVEEGDNVHGLVSRHDGPVSFLQMVPKPGASKVSGDKFADSRPLLVVCADVALSGSNNGEDVLATPSNGSIPNYHEADNGSFAPTVVRFYSLRSQSYVRELKFRSVVYSVRCSSRVIAISQAAQIHCFNASTLKREYNILTNPIVTVSSGSGGIGYGPLAVGPRWLAYSGSPVALSNSGRVSPQHLTPSASFSGFSSNGSLVAHYAKESSKQLAAGIVTLGDMGYKKLSKYCSELQSGSPGWNGNGTVNSHLPDADNIGMVVVRDIDSKLVIAQFRAHKSPISALCFDPSGTLLVTASVQGHNINVFKIMPGFSGSSSTGDAGVPYAYLYKLQRGFTNAVIQDISFSDDSNWIMISSSRGTGHLFAFNPLGGSVNLQSSDASHSSRNGGVGLVAKPSGSPVTLSVVRRIRIGSNGWRGTVTGAAAAATGRLGSLSGAIASSFRNSKSNNELYVDGTTLKTKYHLLVFSPSGSMVQYVLRLSAGLDSRAVLSGLSTSCEPSPESDGKLVVEAVQKWNICQKHNRREREDNVDIYGENGSSDSTKIYPEGMKKDDSVYPQDRDGVAKLKVSPVEKHHLYISEAELQMHPAHVPLWAKSEIYFQSMVTEEIKMDEGGAIQGEIDIERIPTRTIEARAKDLVPVFDYLRTPKYEHPSVPAVDSKTNGSLQHQRSGLSENGRLSSKGSSGSLESMADSGAIASEVHNGFDGWNGPMMPTRGFVNCNDSPKSNTRLEIVNNRESSQMEAQLKFVNNNHDGLKMVNHFEDDSDEFD